MTETPDTSGNQPKAEYQVIDQVVSGQSASTQASAPQVRTVPTRSVGGHVTLRYTPINERGQGDTSTGG
jgi:hypothetical protein